MGNYRSPYREALRIQFVEYAENVRLQKGWSYRDIGTQLGITKQGYQKYLKGSSAPTERVNWKRPGCSAAPIGLDH